MNRIAVVATIALIAVAGGLGYVIGTGNGGSELTSAQVTQVEALLDGRASTADGAASSATALSDDQRFEVEKLVGELVLAAAPPGGGGGADRLSEGQVGEVEGLIRSHLLANPEIITDAINELQARQERQEQLAQVEAIAAHADVIFTSDRHVVIGNPEGDVTLVEFFDYNCHFCRRALDDIQAMIDSDPDLRVVLKEFPVLGEASVEAAQVSVAVSKTDPDKFREFHFALLAEHGTVDRNRALAVAEEMGIDTTAVNALVDTDEVREAINEVYEIAGNLNLTGTPTFVTRDEVVVGAVGLEALQTRIAQIRSN